MFNKIASRVVRVAGVSLRGASSSLHCELAAANHVAVVHPADPSLTVDRVPNLNAEDTERELRLSQEAFLKWKEQSQQERTVRVSRALKALEGDTSIARQLAAGVGKPVSQGSAELRGFCSRAREQISLSGAALGLHAAEAGTQQGSLLGVPVTGDVPGAQPQSGEKALYLRGTLRQPVGVVLALTPWNYPLLTACQYVVPGLQAGNAVVLCPSASVYRAMAKLTQIFAENGVFAQQTIRAEPNALWHAVAKQPVQTVGFVGSTRTGVAVVREAAQTCPLAPVLLEQGGNDAVYVSSHNDEAALDRVADALIEGITWNAGQSCCAPQRVLVHESVAAGQKQRLQERLKTVRMVLPDETLLVQASVREMLNRINGKIEATNPIEMGPMASVAQADRARQLLQTHLQQYPSAELMGSSQQNTGAFFAPGVVWEGTTGSDTGSATDKTTSGLWSEEIFAPLLVVRTVTDLNQGIRLANSSPYGLTACIYTSDAAELAEWTQKAEAGTVMGNRCDYVDPSGVWAGWKLSGRGEMGGLSSFFNLTRAKSVHLRVYK